MSDGQDNWRDMASAPLDGSQVWLRLDLDRVKAYWDPKLDRWVLSHPLHMESIFVPSRWRPILNANSKSE